MFDPQTFTTIHTALSLLALATGLVLLMRLATGQRRDALGAAYLALAVATSVTGFGFPFDHFLPSHAMGVFSLIALATAIVARYRRRLLGKWATVYGVGIAASVYFDALVAVVQAFQKVPALHALAPTMADTPYVVVQTAVFVVLVVLGAAAVRGAKQIT